jgi:hypothetical protein
MLLKSIYPKSKFTIALVLGLLCLGRASYAAGKLTCGSESDLVQVAIKFDGPEGKPEGGLIKGIRYRGKDHEGLVTSLSVFYTHAQLQTKRVISATVTEFKNFDEVGNREYNVVAEFNLGPDETHLKDGAKTNSRIIVRKFRKFGRGQKTIGELSVPCVWSGADTLSPTVHPGLARLEDLEKLSGTIEKGVDTDDRYACISVQNLELIKSYHNRDATDATIVARSFRILGDRKQETPGIYQQTCFPFKAGDYLEYKATKIITNTWPYYNMNITLGSDRIFEIDGVKTTLPRGTYFDFGRTNHLNYGMYQNVLISVPNGPVSNTRFCFMHDEGKGGADGAVHTPKFIRCAERIQELSDLIYKWRWHD